MEFREADKSWKLRDRSGLHRKTTPKYTQPQAFAVYQDTQAHGKIPQGLAKSIQELWAECFPELTFFSVVFSGLQAQPSFLIVYTFNPANLNHVYSSTHMLVTSETIL